MNDIIGEETLASVIAKDPLIAKMTEQDQKEYLSLFNFFISCDEKNKRNHGMDTFIAHLIKVHRFISQKNSLDIFRGFVCGIEFGSGFIIVNTKRLKRLMVRSKSCINGSLQKLGFQMTRKQQDVSGFFKDILPGVDSRLCNSRQWCVRIRTHESPICFVSFLPPLITLRYGFPKPCDDYYSDDEDPIIFLDVKMLLNRPIKSFVC